MRIRNCISILALTALALTTSMGETACQRARRDSGAATSSGVRPSGQSGSRTRIGSSGSTGRSARQGRGSRQSIAAPSQTENQVKMSGTEIFDKYNSAVFIVHADDGKDQAWQGSGFFINPDGVAMTNLHVLAGAYLDDVEMKDGDGRKYGLKEVLWYDEQLDAAIIQVATSGKTNYIPISKREKHVGDKVYALGSPKGLSNTFSSGEISQFRPRKSGGSYYRIQISAPIDHGSSGGALINEYGEAIGITSAGRDDSGANLNFAVDMDDVLERWESEAVCADAQL